MSGNVEWYTPGYIIEAARRTMGAIDLDPASCEEANRTVRADRFYTIADDGLLLPWAGRVWLNPPFGAKDTRRFVGKLADAFDRGVIDQACFLAAYTAPSDGSGGLYNICLGRFPHCHPRSMINFIRPGKRPDGLAWPVLIFYLGPNVERFVECFAGIGAVCAPLKDFSPQGRLF